MLSPRSAKLVTCATTAVRVGIVCIFVVTLSLAAITEAVARDAAFLDPGTGSAVSEEAVKVDPKPEIDVGETTVNAVKRASVFFVNQTNQPVKIEKIVINSDSSVTAEATADDCTKQGVIAPASRCSTEISITPSSPGPWSVDVLMTHNGAGRITRAHLTGKTAGATSTDGKSTGLAVSSKDSKPVDFGDVSVGDGKIVRSTLMVNDSSEPITIYAIDVIEADNGLQRLDQGCAVDMELAPGASCPVTLLWVPKNNGPVSTDLIIRHSGRLGFAVIPIRGVAKGGTAGTDSKGDVKVSDGKKDIVPLPPSAQELEKEMAGKIAPISGAALGGGSLTAETKSSGDGAVHLIGTVGDRILILKADGETVVIEMGGEFTVGGKTAKLVSVSAHSADIVMDGKRKILQLEAAAALVERAARQAQMDNADAKGGNSISGAGSKK